MKNALGSSRLKSVLLVVVLTMLTSACVSKTKHQELISDYETLAEQKEHLTESCDKNAEKLLGQITSLEAQSASLRDQNEELTSASEKMATEKKTVVAEMQEMVSSLEHQLAGEQTRISQLENALKIEVIDRLMFESGSATVTRTGSKIIAKIAPTLAAAVDKDILIIGHTDDLPPSTNLARKYPSNWELSSARAAAIVHILTWNYKIAPTRMTIQGEAHYHPLTAFDIKDNSTRKINRAVEIILTPRQE